MFEGKLGSGGSASPGSCRTQNTAPKTMQMGRMVAARLAHNVPYFRGNTGTRHPEPQQSRECQKDRRLIDVRRRDEEKLTTTRLELVTLALLVQCSNQTLEEEMMR